MDDERSIAITTNDRFHISIAFLRSIFPIIVDHHADVLNIFLDLFVCLFVFRILIPLAPRMPPSSILPADRLHEDCQIMYHQLRSAPVDTANANETSR